MKQRLDESEILQQVVAVAKRLAHPFELREMLEHIVDAGREMLHADRASVLLVDSARHELYSEATSAREEIRFPADMGIAGETLTKRGAEWRRQAGRPDLFRRTLDSAAGPIHRSRAARLSDST